MTNRPVIFGEVLFDRFPDGRAVLGGAPFNVAWHLRGFGFDPLVVSRVGKDAPGGEVLAAMERWGLDTAGMQVDGARPTGAVEITFEGTCHTFHILEDQAYDGIDGSAAARAVGDRDPSLLYHGSLAARSLLSRAALDRLLAMEGLDVFVDVNLRDPFWRAEELPALLERARWCKINDDEVATLSRALGLPRGDLEASTAELQSRFGVEAMIVTLGAAGARARGADGVATSVAPTREVDVVDTVGAGDAFASVVLAGILSGWPMATTLERAQAFASDICGVRGATVGDRAFYNAQTDCW